MYYRDPDNNRVELQIDNFATVAELDGYFHSRGLAENPVGVTYDPESFAANTRPASRSPISCASHPCPRARPLGHAVGPLKAFPMRRGFGRAARRRLAKTQRTLSAGVHRLSGAQAVCCGPISTANQGGGGCNGSGTSAARFVGQSDGYGRVRIHRIYRARPAGFGCCRAYGVCCRGAPPLEECNAVSARRRQLHLECRAGKLRPGLCATARPFGCAIAFRVADAAKAYERAISLGAKPVSGEVDRWRSYSGDRGYRRQLDLPRRPLWRPYDLRCRFRPAVLSPTFPRDPRVKPGEGRDGWGPANVGLTRVDHLTHNALPSRTDGVVPEQKSTSACSISAKSATSTSKEN